MTLKNTSGHPAPDILDHHAHPLTFIKFPDIILKSPSPLILQEPLQVDVGSPMGREECSADKGRVVQTQRPESNQQKRQAGLMAIRVPSTTKAEKGSLWQAGQLDELELASNRFKERP